MSWDDVTEKVNGQLERAIEFRYFALLATFILFLDYCLIVFNRGCLADLSYEQMISSYGVGQVLVFLTLFTLFLSFVVPLIQYVLHFMGIIMPARLLHLFYEDPWRDISPNDYFYISHLERYAIKNGDAVAYAYFQKLVSARAKEVQLNFLCLALCVSVIMNWYAYTISKDALFGWLIPFFSDERLTFSGLIVSMVLWALLVICLYLGVIRGGGILPHRTDRIYFPNHDFR